MKSIRLSRRIGTFQLDRMMIGALMALAAVSGALAWLAQHPHHDPWAPFNLNHPDGWATAVKRARMHADPQLCREVLERSDVAFATLSEQGDGDCQRDDLAVLPDLPLSPADPSATCRTGAGMYEWMEKTVQPAAVETFGKKVARVEHFGTYSCRRINNRPDGRWSQHATANAIDIAAFVLEDGRRISIVQDWQAMPENDDARFLTIARDGACNYFSTVLSPDYNAAHRDHFHLDQSSAYRGACR
ncbi:extensin [Altererythrobacter confluentis]|uniref:Extensin n=1 Tax=Allopontixanthobacter confluentis TaxID=1849021 RepID=A0A6L7GED5_9SPHN|nr:extensin family protein [Allopontixanthobacter confluentis]MXP13960.1 extensin [Allopontixanthobacter confluentis]